MFLLRNKKKTLCGYPLLSGAIEVDYEILSMVILRLQLIQEGPLSVTDKAMSTSTGKLLRGLKSARKMYDLNCVDWAMKLQLNSDLYTFSNSIICWYPAISCVSTDYLFMDYLPLNCQSQQLSSASSSTCDFESHFCKQCGPRSDPLGAVWSGSTLFNINP